jgi:glycosyltransferase involved in cell wall biosynthesis
MAGPAKTPRPLKFLILTQYFLPETGAPPNRLFQLAKRLKAAGWTVTVLTAMPNYPQMKIQEGYQGKFYHYEEIGGIPVHRCWLYTGTSKAIVPRLFNYFSFVLTSMLIGIFRIGRQDWLMVESPPLFLGISAYFLKVLKRARLVFNVSDLWPESAEKLGLVTNRTLLETARHLEEFLYRKAALVTGQTQGIVADISRRFPEKPVRWLKNGVDLNDLKNISANPRWRSDNGFSEQDCIFIYAGILGHAQGLEVILEAARILKGEPDIKFIIMGDGPLHDRLLKIAEELQTTNVTFLGNRPKNEVIPVIMAADAAIIPLRKLDLFRGAIPSKIFENLALRKPLLLGVEGEAKTMFIDQAGAGWAFEPENAESLVAAVMSATGDRAAMHACGNRGYDYLCREFDLDRIADGFRETIIRLSDGTTRS